MNKQEAIEKIKDLWSYTLEDVPLEVDLIIKNQVLDIISQIHEPEKPVVPQFVADFYESIKEDFEDKVYDLCVQFNNDNEELNRDVWGWFDFAVNKPIETLVKMKLYGYEVEKEKLYTVEIPNPNSKGTNKIYLCKDDTTGKVYLCKGNFNPSKNRNLRLTESEIKQDFDWAWQFAKEVEGE